ncbi:MAG: thermonuclease family protein [Candidatus Nomurabacteria bacterium]|nr:thermonuclease family protein [Candidatus Nomurabacteria bacterium]
MAHHGPDPFLKRWTFAVVIASVIVLLSFLYNTQREVVLGIVNSGVGAKAQIPIGPYYKVTRVVDGDTIVVDINGVEEKIRLIGINTPETVDTRKIVECFGKEASARMEELVNGKNVRLESDDTQSLRDIYGRMLDYVYLEDGQMLNRKMIAEGYAYEYTYMTPYKYQKEFREIQTLARVSSRGLWAAETCSGKK